MIKSKEIAVTKSHLEASIKYIDLTLSGRFRAMENKFNEMYVQPSEKHTNQLNLITKMGYISVCLLTLIVIMMFVDVTKVRMKKNPTDFGYLNSMQAYKTD